MQPYLALPAHPTFPEIDPLPLLTTIGATTGAGLASPSTPNRRKIALDRLRAALKGAGTGAGAALGITHPMGMSPIMTVPMGAALGYAGGAGLGKLIGLPEPFTGDSRRG